MEISRPCRIQLISGSSGNRSDLGHAPCHAQVPLIALPNTLRVSPQILKNYTIKLEQWYESWASREPHTYWMTTRQPGLDPMREERTAKEAADVTRSSLEESSGDPSSSNTAVLHGQVVGAAKKEDYLRRNRLCAALTGGGRSGKGYYRLFRAPEGVGSLIKLYVIQTTNSDVLSVRLSWAGRKQNTGRGSRLSNSGFESSVER